jgi:hypothetical protein
VDGWIISGRLRRLQRYWTWDEATPVRGEPFFVASRPGKGVADLLRCEMSLVRKISSAT